MTTENPDTLDLRIEGPAVGGSSVARHDGRVVFVSGALPGERVRARVLPGAKASFLRAEALEVLEASEHRVPDRRTEYLAEAGAGDGASEPFGGTELFGGMEYGHVDLAHSRTLKAQVVTDQLARLGGIDREVTVAAAPGESTGLDWRTRVQLAVTVDGRLGMVRAGSHDVVPLTRVPLAVPAIAEVDLPSLRLPGAARIEFAWSGSSGAVIVRGDGDRVALGECAARLPADWSILAGPAAPARSAARSGAERSTSGRGARGREQRGQRGSSRGSHGSRGSRSSRGSTSAPGLEIVRGSDHLIETAAGRDFRVAADGFWQVHTSAPALLTSAVLDAVPTGTRTLTDLYCGVGLLGISAAAATGATLFGVEGVGAAIENARVNGADLDAQFVVGRVDRMGFPASDVVLLDPPRAGAGRAVTDRLVADGPDSIVYVSCDAGTLARDLAALTAGGYEIDSLKGFDLFPLTAHVETVTVLRR